MNINELKNKTVCTRPWTSIDERSVHGDIRICCWINAYLGRIDKAGSADFLSFRNNKKLIEIREKMLKGKYRDFCDPDCPVLTQRDDNFNSLEFWNYTPEEYALLPEKFRENREKVISAIENQQTNTDTYPLRLQLFPSSICNLECRMCQLDKGLKPQISENYFQNVYQLFPYLENIGIFGGEPFACPTTRKILFSGEIEKHPQLHFSTITNGVLLNEKVQDQLSQMRLGWFDFSLDSCHKQTYEQIRIPADFDKTMLNVKNFMHRVNSKQIRINTVRFVFVIQKLNYHEISDFIEFSVELGAEPNFILINGSSELLTIIEDVKKAIAEGIKKAEYLGNNSTSIHLQRILKQIPTYVEREKFLKRVNRYPAIGILKKFVQNNPTLKKTLKNILHYRK
jgi:molybdenum cofactor biosynthesis enzyme MoaA